ncbi:hypothetical protein Bca4012_001608 [Brassica carinata]|uniref:Uncharacterized protein n=1 Tax=Brassica carinata TaxID=52824 RepID=A0A8X7S0G4_BRACI|nr:hypothetical protein Bca52824_043612 [Brassica carinata]
MAPFDLRDVRSRPPVVVAFNRVSSISASLRLKPRTSPPPGRALSLRRRRNQASLCLCSVVADSPWSLTRSGEKIARATSMEKYCLFAFLVF